MQRTPPHQPKPRQLFATWHIIAGLCVIPHLLGCGARDGPGECSIFVSCTSSSSDTGEHSPDKQLETPPTSRSSSPEFTPCEGDDCSPDESSAIPASPNSAPLYIKASDSAVDRRFGEHVALDGTRLTTVGAPEQTYVFELDADQWTEQTRITTLGLQASDVTGTRVALNGDHLFIGKSGDTSGSRGTNGDPLDQSTEESGAVWHYTKDGLVWRQASYLKASNADALALFGSSLAANRNTLSIGAPRESQLAQESGAAYVFVLTGAQWAEQSYLKAANAGPRDHFGHSIALSGDTLAVGAPGESSAGTGVSSAAPPPNTENPDAGATYIFERQTDTWQPQAYLKASNAQSGQRFGYALALADNTLVVGAPGEDNSPSNFGLAQDDTTHFGRSGAAYVFVRVDGEWQQEAYLKASNANAGHAFASCLALAGDTLAIGAPFESSFTRGINPAPSTGYAERAGAVYIFKRGNEGWSQVAHIKAPNTRPGAEFGYSLALTDTHLAIGARREAGAGTGIDADPNLLNAENSGAVYLYSASAW